MKSRSRRFNEFGEDLSQKRREIVERCVVACITIVAIVVVGYAAIRNEQTRKVKRAAAAPTPVKPVVRVAEVLKGIEFLKDNDNGAAAASFSRAIELDRKNVEALVARGVALARQGDLAAAESDFLAALHLNTISSSIFNNLAYVRCKKKDFRVAVEYFTKALDLDSSLISAYGGRAFCYFQKGDYSLALDDLSHIVRLDNRSSSALVNRAIVLGKMNRFETAVTNLTNPVVQSLDWVENRKLAAFYQSQSGHALDCLTNCEAGLAKTPEDSEFVFLSLVALKLIAESDANAESKASWETAKERISLETVTRGQENLQKLSSTFLLEGFCNPQLLLFSNLSTLAVPPSEKVAAQQLKEAHEYLRVGDLETAVACFRESLRNTPNNKETVFKLAMAMVDQGRNAMAADELSKLAKRYPDDTKILVVQSMVFSRLEKYADAIGALDRAISIDQGDASLYLHRAHVRFLSSQDFEQVIEDCRRTERLGTVNSELLDIKGRSLAKVNEFAAAIDAQSAAIEMKPDSPDLLLNRAETYRLSKDLDLAIADTEKALSMSKDAKGAFEMARCQFEKGAYEKSLDAIEEALIKSPKAASYVMLKGQVLTKLGKYSEAATIFKTLESKLNANEIYMYLAICTFHLKEPEVAWSYIAKFFDKEEPNVDSLAIAAQIAHAIGDHGKAKNLIDRFIKAGGNSPEIDLLMGKYAAERSDWNGSIDYFKKYLKSNKASHEAWLAAGDSFEHLNEPKRALQCYANAIQVNQDSAEARIARAKLQVTIADYRNALTDLEWLNEHQIKSSEVTKMFEVCKSKLVKTRSKKSTPSRSK